MHPQDGPHADLRVAIEDELVRFSIGVNLAFLDETVDVPREALNELSLEESNRVLDAFRDFLVEQAPCRINGQQIDPVFEHLEIFTHPDPGMIAIFPKMGARALIRATAVMRFDAPSSAESVDLTWPSYPLDLLAEEMEQAGSSKPRMYFEVVLTANGKTKPARFTSAEPTLRWSSANTDSLDPLLTLPDPVAFQAPASLSRVPVILIALAALSIGYGLFRNTSPTWKGVLTVVTIIFATGIVHHFTTTNNQHSSAQTVLSEDDAKRVLNTLHESMYRAFDYTSESDIYDRLELALQGDLLSDLYEQIRLSLLQADEEMKVGVVTGLEHIHTSIRDIDLASESPLGLGFEALHSWRVDGTVYHWGHSHTRAHVYEAHYRVSYTPDGWRLTEHELRSQQRIDPNDGTSLKDLTPIEKQLQELGYPDL
ncbi:MAG: hypothetical protein AB8C13_01345 [Phycisphaerales bacterium]